MLFLFQLFSLLYNMNKTHYTTSPYEKSIPIKIKKIIRPNEKNSLDGEYSLKKNVFDPFKNSPPNEFMSKLNIRCFLYHNYKKDDKRDSE